MRKRGGGGSALDAFFCEGIKKSLFRTAGSAMRFEDSALLDLPTGLILAGRF